MRTYHVGLEIGSGRVKYWGNGARRGTVVVHACQSIDHLPCTIHEYLGERETTKRALIARLRTPEGLESLRKILGCDVRAVRLAR